MLGSMLRQLTTTLGITVVLFPVALASLSIGLAQVMQSSSYQIQSDSVNVGGGYSTSSSYTMESTVGEVATGRSTSTSYALNAGYQQMQDAYLAMIVGLSVALSPSIPGVSGGVASGSTTVQVITDNLAGYQLTIQASNDPAMQSGANTIADYVPAGLAPDYTFTTGVADAHFGFSPNGADVVDRYRVVGSLCNEGGGSVAPGHCWDGLSTVPVAIAATSSANHPLGTETVIDFKVGIGGSVVQPEGVYVATTTVTALLQ